MGSDTSVRKYLFQDFVLPFVTSDETVTILDHDIAAGLPHGRAHCFSSILAAGDAKRKWSVDPARSLNQGVQKQSVQWSRVRGSAVPF